MIDNRMLKQRFRSSIRRGTGEVCLIMQNNPTIDFSADIIKASLTNYAYDGQSEGSRAFYVSELIARSKQQSKIRDAILKGLETENKDTGALVQLFDLATIYAKQGNNEAKKAIYNRFFKKIFGGCDWCGYTSIIELDGLEGLKYIARTIGKSLEKNPEDWQDSSIIHHFQQINPEIKALQELENAGKTDRYIKIYLDNIKQTENGREEYKRPVVNYKTVSERINKKILRPLSPVMAKQLSKTDIKKLADDFLKETDRLKQQIYMSVFNRVKYPYDHQPILEIVKGRNKKSDRLVAFASGALRYFSGDDIREFATDRLSTTKKPFDYLDLLISNYQKGDSKLLTTIVKNCKSEDSLHSIIISLIHIYNANKTKECKEPLEAVYDRLTCGLCRTDIVKILIKNKVLSKKIKEEIEYDCEEDTRKLSIAE